MGIFACEIFQESVFDTGPCDGIVAERRPEQQPAGRVYAPVRKRKPERLVFLERELVAKHERERELQRRAQQAQIAAAEAKADERAFIEAEAASINAELRQIEAAIAGLIREIQLQIERDEDDAIAAILMVATLH